MSWTLKVVLFSTLVGITIFCLGVFVWAGTYDGRLPPHTTIDGIEVGGMDPESVRQTLQARIDEILTRGIEVVVKGERRTLSLATLSSSELAEDVHFDLDGTLGWLMQAHNAHPAADAAAMLFSFISPRVATIPVTLQEDRIRLNVLALFPESETLAKDASFMIANSNGAWTIDVISGASGTEFQWQPFFVQLKGSLERLDASPIELTLLDQPPRVLKATALAQIDAAQAALAAAPYKATHAGDVWELGAAELSAMLAPGENRELALLDEPFAAWILQVTNDVNRNVRDARLTIENGRVTDFVESLEGVTVDEETLKSDILAAIRTAIAKPVELVVTATEPTVTTGDVNDLGIDEILGVGTSSYRGSPVNRRGNIQNGVDLLNGLLIAPGETFSLLKALSPFTTDNGYLPELVIKGDKITPEIGGGLCQIGTTTFRAAMNAGLPIVERQNHSLVVSYYNDPANGNPGTDATIYEPAPDFKFLNDTGHYILFQAENLTDTQELRFTFWGTRDGRMASYSPPVVSRWIPVGETQYIETLDLEPGVEQCQSSHIGADASFVYTVVNAQGAVSETTFESHYRPLPRICLVGVEELTAQESPPQSLSTETLAPLIVAP